MALARITVQPTPGTFPDVLNVSCVLCSQWAAGAREEMRLIDGYELVVTTGRGLYHDVPVAAAAAHRHLAEDHGIDVRFLHAREELS